MTKKENLLKGIIKENPLFVSLLGTCPALATTTSLESALGMGILFMFVLIGSNIVISLLRKIIPDEVKIPLYIVIIATFVTIVKMLSEALLPELYDTLGVFWVFGMGLGVPACPPAYRGGLFGGQSDFL